MSTHRILFICLGNICRSPTAEGILRRLVRERELEHRFEIDSAGTGDWHIGCPPDPRAQHASLQRGIDISSLRARQVSAADLARFDSVIAMDLNNLQQLKKLAPVSHHHKIRLLLDYTDTPDHREVPDPYYGGNHGFDRMIDLLEDACDHLLSSLVEES